MDKNFQQIIFEEFKVFLGPLENVDGNADKTFRFFEACGWDIHSLSGGNLTSFYSEITTIVNGVSTVTNIIANPPKGLLEFLDAVDQVLPIIQSIQALPGTFSGIPAGIIGDLTKSVLEKLLVTYIYRRSPFMFHMLELIGVITEDTQANVIHSGTLVRFKAGIPNIDLGKLGDFITDPAGTIEQEYWPSGLGTKALANAAGKKLFDRMVPILEYLGITAKVGVHDGPEFYTVAETEELKGMLFLYKYFLLPGVTDEGRVYAAIGILSAAEGGPGVFIVPGGEVSLSQEFGNYQVDLDFSAGLQAIEVTGNGVTVNASPPLNNASADLTISPVTDGEKPAYLIGSETGTRLQIGDWNVKGGMAVGGGSKEFYVKLELIEGAIVIKGGDGDGFFQKILPPDGATINFDLGIGWSSTKGVFFDGGAGLDIVIPVHKDVLGFLRIEEVPLSIYIDGAGLDINLGITGSTQLGPVLASFSKLGLKIPVQFTEGGGNLGPIDASFGFKLPEMIGLAIESSAISGGGFLYINQEKGEYAGGVELNIKDKIHVSAIGIINTKMPDGSDGFSLLVIIAAEFTPIQLGLGFTLNGVGGLLGLNRTVDFERMREGIKTKTLDSILFPKDIVKNANKIISDLQQVFPVEKKRFVFGPMAILGWGTPTLISAELGVIIEVPSPIRIGILGVVRCILPTEDAAILKLQIAFLGVLDFEKKLISFDASIYDSSLLAFSLSGDMALRIGWGDNKRFVISFGGFHPRFQAPPDLTRLERMTLTIRSSQPRIVLESYFAVTSNTVQIGAKLELYHKLKLGYHIEGRLGFDALFQFNPFYMLLEIYFSLAVKKGNSSKLSISLDLSLEGPRPWKAKGKAKFKILMIKFSANVSATWGKSQNTSLPNKAVMPELKNALEQDPNWEALWPQGKGQLVKLREMESGSLIVHPFGKLQVGQKIVPLDLNIEKFGDFSPTLPGKYTISAVRLAGNPVDYVDLRDDFAPAHFRKMDDNAKLSSASFKKFNAGVSFKGTEDLDGNYYTKREIRYETAILDSGAILNLPQTTESPLVLEAFSTAAVAANTQLSYTASAKSALAPDDVTIVEENYGVVYVSDLTLHTTDAMFPSLEEALDHMNDLVMSDPTLLTQLQVMPEFELV